MSTKLKKLFLILPLIIFSCNKKNESFIYENQNNNIQIDSIKQKNNNFTTHLNKDVSPCTNFYEYVCSEEEKKYKLSNNKSGLYIGIDKAETKVKEQRKQYLKSLIKQKGLNNRNRTLKDFYQACLNTNLRESESKTYIENYLNNLSFYDKNKMLDYLFQESIFSNINLIKILEVPNKKNNKVKDLLFYHELPLMNKIFYENNDLLEDYKILIEQLFETLKINDSSYHANFIIDFERKISKIYPQNISQIYYNSDISIERSLLLNKYSNLYFNKILNKIPNHINLNIISEEVFLLMNDIFEKASTSELFALSVWYKLNDEDLVKFSLPIFYSRLKEFKNKYFGSSLENLSIENECTNIAENFFGRNIDYEISKNYYKNFSNNKIVNMIDQIKKEYISALKNSNWLSENSKNKAEIKLNKMKFQIVRPNNMTDWNLENLIKIDVNQYYLNILKLKERNFKKLINEINHEIINTKWQMSPLSANAYYDQRANQFIILLGLLQPPFYDVHFSENLNYGGIGVVIAHEIAHSIDNYGANYDEIGNYNPWMSDLDQEKFKIKSEKFVNFFNNSGINAIKTLSENLSDFNALRFSYKAAKIHDKDISVKKDFFIQSAKIFCAVYSPLEKENLLKNSNYSPPDFRVNNQMKLSKEFSSIFSCKKEDPLYFYEENFSNFW